MKKFLSILLAVSMLIGICGVSAFATEAEDFSVYPESEHNYPNAARISWRYVHPEETEGLFVTFSEDTYFEPPFEDFENGEYKSGDYLAVYWGGNSRRLDDDFYGDMLAGKTIYIPTSTFELILWTDESVDAYGFKIDRIDTVLPEGVNAICYNLEPNESGVNKYYDCYESGETMTVKYEMSFYNNSDLRNGNEFRCGWSTSPEGELEYSGGEEITTDENIFNLYGAWVPLSISADEVYGFSNTDYYFDVDRDPNLLFPTPEYYMTPDDHEMLLRNAFRLGLPGIISYKVLKEYPQKDFQGACFGMACTVFLQHHGVIDMLSLQEGAENLHDLDNSPEVLSVINYYQSLTIMSFLCQNQAPYAGTAEYKKQLKDLFETASAGKPVLLSVLGDNYIFGNNHTVVVTGAYTDKQGNHYLLAYGGMDGYAERTIVRYEISPDFSSLNGGNTFYWTDDYTHLEAFDMDGNGSTFKWYEKFVPQMFSLLIMLLRFVPTLLK